MSVELSIGDILEEREDNSQSSIKGALEEHYDDDVERSEMWYRSGETVRLYDLGDETIAINIDEDSGEIKDQQVYDSWTEMKRETGCRTPPEYRLPDSKTS